MVGVLLVPIARTSAWSVSTVPLLRAWRRKYSIGNAFKLARWANTRVSDASVLTRLTNLETRMQAIDQTRLDSPFAISVPDKPVVMVWPKIPDFHHAAAHKMFHYWSKLRVNLTIPNLEPLKFLQQVDEADTTLFGQDHDNNIPAEAPISLVIQGIESIFENIGRLPFLLRHLFTYAGLSNEVCLEVFRRHAGLSPGVDAMLAFNAQNVEELLLQTLALKHLAALRRDYGLSQRADVCFRYALQQMWSLQAQQSPQALRFKFLFVICLIYLYGRPFHALGLLQSLESSIQNLSPKPLDGRQVNQKLLFDHSTNLT